LVCGSTPGFAVSATRRSTRSYVIPDCTSIT
jgi:hypothetical protein